VLQTGEYQRLGSSTALHADVRWVAATNADLPAAIARGAFRADLYYRLAVIEIRIPPLAERPDDIEPLAEHFLAAHGIAKEALDTEARRALLEYAWPGNVRELENRVQRAVLLGSGRRVGASDLFGPVQGLPATGEAERAEVESALRDAAGVVSRAARSLAITRQALYRKMMRLGISVERRVKP
jgi:DNA-binding NtrC family response regulator